MPSACDQATQTDNVLDLFKEPLEDDITNNQEKNMSDPKLVNETDV